MKRKKNSISSTSYAFDPLLLAMTFLFNFLALERKGAELPTPRQILYPREKVRIGWKSTERKWVPGAGMINVGNTCYLNSTLQALFHVPALANWLISDYVHRETCEEKSEYTLNLWYCLKFDILFFVLFCFSVLKQLGSKADALFAQWPRH